MGQLGLAEQTGHGNPDIVRVYGTEAFEIADSHITVTIPFAFEPSMRQISYEGLGEAYIAVMKAMQNDPFITREKICEYCELGKTRVQEIINDLKKADRIERIGGNKGGYWAVK